MELGQEIAPLPERILSLAHKFAHMPNQERTLCVFDSEGFFENEAPALRRVAQTTIRFIGRNNFEDVDIGEEYVHRGLADPDSWGHHDALWAGDVLKMRDEGFLEDVERLAGMAPGQAKTSPLRRMAWKI